MKKLLKKIFTISLITYTYLSIFVVPAQAQEAWDANVNLHCTGTGSGIEGADDVATIQGLGCLIGNVLSVALTMIGMLALLMFIAASFRYMTSGGNSKSTEQARSTITYAVAGIVVALSAFILLNLISSFTGINVSQFIIPGADTSPTP